MIEIKDALERQALASNRSAVARRLQLVLVLESQLKASGAPKRTIGQLWERAFALCPGLESLYAERFGGSC